MYKSLAICKVCRTANKCSGSTTNLKTRLVRHCGENYATRKTTTWLLKTFSSHNLANSKVITASTARFIAKDLRHYRVVESDGFRDMVR